MATLCPWCHLRGVMNIPGAGRASCVLMDTVRPTPASQTPHYCAPTGSLPAPLHLLGFPIPGCSKPLPPWCGRRPVWEMGFWDGGHTQRPVLGSIPHHSLISGLGKAHLWESREGQLKEDPRREEEKGDAGVNLPCLHPQRISTSCSAFNSCHL